MSNKYFIQNPKSNLVIDIEEKRLKNGEIPPAGTGLDVFTNQGKDNQLWTFVQGPEANPGFFLIRNPQSNLVIDIEEKDLKKGETPPAGTELDVFTNQGKGNQLWQIVAGPSDKPNFFFIQSLLGDLVIDIEEKHLKNGEIPPAGTGLDVFTNQGKDNQLWTLKSAPGNSFDPKITSFLTDITLNSPSSGEVVSVSGTGYFPGATLSIVPTFQLVDSDGSVLTTQGQPILATADFSGDFFASAPLISWVLSGEPGTFFVTVTCNQISPSQTFAHATWNGSQFSDFSNG
jgi:hypothetical protein